jgi:lysophospholipase L1-like esterase
MIASPERLPPSPSLSTCSSSSSLSADTPSPVLQSVAPPSAVSSRSSGTKYILLAFFLAGALIGWSLRAWEAVLIKAGRAQPVVLLVGDSLTEKGLMPSPVGWAVLLQNDCKRSMDVVSRGLAGYNTKWYLKYAMPAIHDEISRGSYTPALVLIWLGANDAALQSGSVSQSHVPIHEYEHNLARLVTSFQAVAPRARILLITPPYVDDAVQRSSAQAHKGPAHSNAVAGQYARVCVDVAAKLKVPVLNLHTLFNSLPEYERSELLVDGLHFNTTGHSLMYRELRDKIEAELPDINVMLQRWPFPHYEDFLGTDSWSPDSNTVDFMSVRVRG